MTEPIINVIEWISYVPISIGNFNTGHIPNALSYGLNMNKRNELNNLYIESYARLKWHCRSLPCAYRNDESVNASLTSHKNCTTFNLSGMSNNDNESNYLKLLVW